MEQKPIEKLKPMTSGEKVWLTIKKFTQVRAAAYTVSAVAGLSAGHVAQNVERTMTGYDPVAHASLKKEMEKPPINDYEAHKREQAEKEKKGILDRARDWMAKIKNGVLNPKQFIENTEMYKTLKLQYLSILKFIDDISFLVPALLTFIMLGGFLTKTLSKLGGNPAEKEERKRIIAKINELVDASNGIYEKIQAQGVASLSLEEIEQTKAMLRAAAVALPEKEDLELVEDVTPKQTKRLDIELP